ncbi:MAG: NTP transferase domain-containing protein [Spirochaetales bacterium]
MRLPYDCVLLAAGEGRRMGGGKLLRSFRGRPLILHALESAAAACRRVIVVTGFDDKRVKEAVTAAHSADPTAAELTFVHNPNYRLGMFSSIQAGARVVRSDRFFVLPADLPLVTAAAFEAVAAEPAADAVVPVVEGTRGHPVLIRSSLIPALTAAAADAGPMRHFLRDYRVHWAECEDNAMIRDVDTAEALEALDRNREH